MVIDGSRRWNEVPPTDTDLTAAKGAGPAASMSPCPRIPSPCEIDSFVSRLLTSVLKQVIPLGKGRPPGS